MVKSFSIVRVLADGLLVLRTRHGSHIFSRRKLRARRSPVGAICYECGRSLRPGELAYGEVSSCSSIRAARICKQCIERAFEAAAPSKQRRLS